MAEVMTVTPLEAAARLGLGRQLVYRLLKAGRLPAVKVGRRPHYRVPVRALEEALAEPERLSIGAEEGAGNDSGRDEG
jgi:excisionase family DNA binding protein